MENRYDKDLEHLITSIEFPGESEKEIAKYLDERGFTDRVMKAIEEENSNRNKIIFWFVFTILNIIILSLIGTNQFIKNQFFALHEALATLFYFFLGVSVFGGIVGIISYMDTKYISHLPEEILDNIAKVKNRFLGR